MDIIQAKNVNDAFVKGVELMRAKGVEEETRAGRALVMPTPVVTIYSHPWERVLFNPKRDANPWFHLGEALWHLAGRQDAAWLDQFVHDFSERFAERNGILHGAYGYRWRQHFVLDQLDYAVELLKTNPNDRRVVIQMWDPLEDLGTGAKDIPCNLEVLPRINLGLLDITVFCRSNDLVWGAYGANAVQFSILQEYLARRIGVGMGLYYQISNNFHAYTDVLAKQDIGDKRDYSLLTYSDGGYVATPIVTVPESFDADLALFLAGSKLHLREDAPYQNSFFTDVATPMFAAYAWWKSGDRRSALEELTRMPTGCDWKLAAYAWFMRRNVNMELQANVRRQADRGQAPQAQ